MVLRKTTIPVLFNGGLDQSTTDKLVAPGQFTLLENAVRRKKGLIQKRNGFNALGKGIISSDNSVVEGKRLHRFNNDLVLLNNTNIYSYSSANDAWSDRGFITSVLVDSEAVVRNSDSQAMIDMCSSGGLTAFAYEDSRNSGIRLTIVDDDTGSPIVYDQQIATTASRPKVNCTGTHILVTFIDGTGLYMVAVNKTTPQTVPAAVQIQNDIADAPYDLAPYNTGLAFAYTVAGSLDIKIGYITGSGAVGSTGNGFASPIVNTTYQADRALSIVTDQNNNLLHLLCVDDSTNEIFQLTYTADLNTSTKATVETLADVYNITGVLNSDDSLDIFYDVVTGARINAYIKKTSSTYSGTITVGAISTFARSVGLATKAFKVGELTYVGGAFDTDLQPTYYMFDTDGNVVARMLSQIGGGLMADVDDNLKSGLPKVEVDLFGTYSFPAQIRNRLEVEDDGQTLSAYVGVQRMRLEFDAAEYDGAQLGQNLHIAGGLLLDFDGVRAVEHGFNHFPENVVPGTISGTLDGTYGFRVIYEWVDGRGQIHRSAPSTTFNRTFSGTTGTRISIPALRLTRKEDVKVVVYMTAAGGASVYYRVAEKANDPTGTNVLVDVTDDTGLTNNEILYTVGGTLDNVAAPAAKVVHKHKNRLFLGGLEDNNTILYSREHVTGEGVFFSDFLTLKVDSLGGGVTALATLDDKLIIFKRDATFALVGDGPTDNGTLNDYSIPELISGDIGCIDPRSIARTPLGIMFKSEKGIWLLDRGLSFVNIGDRVEDFDGETVTSATVIDDQDEVRFTTDGDTCLVFNYDENQWSTFTNYGAVSAIMALGRYHHLKADGTCNREDDSYDDNGTRIKMAIETGWFNFGTLNSNWYGMNGPLGFQRIYRLGFLGEFYAHHHLKLQLAYDFEKAYTDTIYYATDGNIASNFYGDDALYGDSEVYGGTQGTVLQWRHKPTRQKCGSIKVRMEDIDTVGAESSASFGFISLAFEVGVKSGVQRMGPGNTIGNG